MRSGSDENVLNGSTAARSINRYLAVALSAYATGAIASRFGLRPRPFYLGIAFATLGLLLSLFFVRDTMGHVAHEASVARDIEGVNNYRTRELFALVSWSDPGLFSASQAGLVNNLNDGLAWGLFPIYFAAAGLTLREIGLLAFIYPATWGIMQLWTGALSDRVGRNPAWRARAVGVYRLWRDLGYAVGALTAGVLADIFGVAVAITAIGVLTGASGLIVAGRMPETLPSLSRRAG